MQILSSGLSHMCCGVDASNYAERQEKGIRKAPLHVTRASLLVLKMTALQ